MATPNMPVRQSDNVQDLKKEVAIRYAEEIPYKLPDDLTTKNEDTMERLRKMPVQLQRHLEGLMSFSDQAKLEQYKQNQRKYNHAVTLGLESSLMAFCAYATHRSFRNSATSKSFLLGTTNSNVLLRLTTTTTFLCGLATMSVLSYIPFDALAYQECKNLYAMQQRIIDDSASQRQEILTAVAEGNTDILKSLNVYKYYAQ